MSAMHMAVVTGQKAQAGPRVTCSCGQFVSDLSTWGDLARLLRLHGIHVRAVAPVDNFPQFPSHPAQSAHTEAQG